jgi:hypothetical protein
VENRAMKALLQMKTLENEECRLVHEGQRTA